MGFSDMIDLAGSMLIGGLMMLLIFRMSDSAAENVYNNGGELILQRNLAATAEVLEADFRKIGYCSDWSKIPDPSKSILQADSTSIKFLTDVDSDGDVDTMQYFAGSPSDLVQTANPRDRLLYRVINNETPAGVNLGVTQFKLAYFNALGDTLNLPISMPSEIYTMEINITVENTEAYDQKYSSARNLRNR
jgi:hypothetical protein